MHSLSWSPPLMSFDLTASLTSSSYSPISRMTTHVRGQTDIPAPTVVISGPASYMSIWTGELGSA